ncbi:MAG TPA: FkbM family methyltransferase [Bacteroidia bacterium]
MLKSWLEKIGGINLIDIGSSGGLSERWMPCKKYINLIGFDPNAEECKRMSALPSGFRTVKYIPYAISGVSGESVLYKTKSIFCYSLLKPNTQWLERFCYSDLFEVVGSEKIQTRSLNDIEELQEFNPDIIKTDTQGLELPILNASGDFLENAFYVETETGFLENYVGETTYSQIDEFMRAKGFLLFDINMHRIARKNIFSAIHSNAEQILWCEAVWLKDYVALSRQDENVVKSLSKEKVLKILLICAIQGCIDYGYELAQLFYQFGKLTPEEFDVLKDKENWVVFSKQEIPKMRNRLLVLLFRLLPTKYRCIIMDAAHSSTSQKHLFRF